MRASDIFTKAMAKTDGVSNIFRDKIMNAKMAAAN